MNQSRADFEASVASLLPALSLQTVVAARSSCTVAVGAAAASVATATTKDTDGTDRTICIIQPRTVALNDGFSEARLRACTEAGLLGRINSTTLTTTVACASR